MDRQGAGRGARLRCTCFPPLSPSLGCRRPNHDREEPYSLGEGYSHIAFVVEDLDALAQKLEEAGGVDFESEPHAMSSGTRIFFVRDPDGYRIEFIERA